MKVAIVLPRKFIFENHKPNSIETVVRTFTKYSSSETEIAVFCDEGAHDHGPIDTIVVDPRGGRRARNRRIIREIEHFNPDIIEVHQHVSSVRQFASAFPKTPCILYRHNKTKRPKNWFSYQLHRYRYRACTGYIFVSDFLRDEFKEIYPELAHRAHCVHNTIEFEPWLAEVDGKPNLIAYGGRAAPEKGFAEICQVVPVILDRYPNWSFEMCAHDWDRHKDWADCQFASLQAFGPRVICRKNQPLSEVQNMLKRAAISLVPSIFEEPFGLAALEAHAAGAAVISSGRGGLREASGEHAEYIDAINAANLKQAIAKLIDNPTQRLSMALQGQNFIQERHSASEGAIKLADLRRRLIERGVEGKS